MKHLDEEEGGEVRIGSLPMEITNYTDRTESETPPVQTPNTPDPVQEILETPSQKGMFLITALQEPPIPSRNTTHENRIPSYKVKGETDVTRRVKLIINSSQY